MGQGHVGYVLGDQDNARFCSCDTCAQSAQGVKREKFQSLKIQIGIARERAKDMGGWDPPVVVGNWGRGWMPGICRQRLWDLGRNLFQAMDLWVVLYIYSLSVFLIS